MNIVDAPFVGIAKPERQTEIAQAYWCTPTPVKKLAKLYGLGSSKAVTKAAGKATLLGVACRHCKVDIVANNRGDALHEIAQSRRGNRSRAECRPCFFAERDKRMKERLTKHRYEPPLPKQKKDPTPNSALKDAFYKSWEWRTLRMQALQKYGRACQCCGAQPGDLDVAGKPVRIVVDHIKPISKHWGLRLDLSNLQILCDECNMGKGNWDETDFRPEPPKPATIEDERLALVMAQLGEEGTLQ